MITATPIPTMSQFSNELDCLRAREKWFLERLESIERNAALGASVERAARDLPDGYDLHIELEKGAGTVRLYIADTDSSVHDFDGDCFADHVNKAIDFAVDHEKGSAK